MRLSFALLPVLCVFGLSAQAQTPPDVMKAYKAYNAAFAANDFKGALKHGKTAWTKAEKSLGDSKTTGDLAFNYGFLAKSQGEAKAALKPLERSVELASIGRDNPASVRMERSVELVSAAENAGEPKLVSKFADRSLKYAAEQGLENSVFTGEILVHRAAECSRRVNRAAQRLIGKPTSSRLAVQTDQKGRVAKEQKACAVDSRRASAIFANQPNMARPKYIALAAKQTGLSYEREEDWVNAAMSYQKARLAVEDKYGRDNPVVMQMVGRWINARSRLVFQNKLQTAKAAGLCDCWPFDQSQSKVKVVKRVKPDVPRNAIALRSSGVVVLKTDVTDAGDPVNIEVVYSWPQGEYDGDAKAAFKQYKFAPKSGQEAVGVRKDVVENFSFIMFNESNRETY